MMISICNSNIRESGTQRPLQGAVALRLGVRTPGATKKAFAVAKAVSWSQQGMILRPPDYESGATNQLSYGTENSKNLKFTEPPFGVTALQRYEIFFEFQLANLDLDLDTTWEFKLHEGINGLLGRLVDVEKAAV